MAIILTGFLLLFLIALATAMSDPPDIGSAAWFWFLCFLILVVFAFAVERWAGQYALKHSCTVEAATRYEEVRAIEAQRDSLARAIDELSKHGKS